MNTKILVAITSCLLWPAGSALAGQVGANSQGGGLPALAERVAALEAIVAVQSNQIGALRRALAEEVRARINADSRVLAAVTNHTAQQIAREAAARRAGDSALQAQINNLSGSEFTPDQVATLKGLTGVLTVAGTNVYLAGGVCVGGDLAVAGNHHLFVSHILPSDGSCSGDPAGITIFGGNVGIMATNTLYVNQLRAFEAVPPSPQELQQTGVFLGRGLTIVADGDNVFVEGPMLFRSR